MSDFFQPVVSSVDGASLVTDFIYDLLEGLRVRQPSWAEILGFAPPGLMPFLDGRVPVDVTVQAIKRRDGESTYGGLSDLFIPYGIEEFYTGVEESPRRLMDPRSGLILSWQRAPAGMVREWDVFANVKVAALLSGGKTTGQVWTKGANFFAASGHYFNPKRPDLGTFGNLFTGDNVGPWYTINANPQWGMAPWAVIRGQGNPPPQNAGSFRTAEGLTATVFDYQSEHYANYGTLRIKTEASYGFCLMHPQAITRSEKTVNYANVLAAVNNVRTMKDLGGHEAADDSGIVILAPKGLLSSFESVLTRQMCDDGGGVSVSNELRDKGIKLVGLTV